MCVIELQDSIMQKDEYISFWDQSQNWTPNSPWWCAHWVFKSRSTYSAFFCCFPSVLVPGTQHTCNEDNKQFCNFLKALSSTQDILEPFWDPERALLSTLFLKGLALKWRNSEFLIFMATDWTYSSSLFIKCKYDIFVKRSETIIYTYSRQIDLKM